MSGGRSIDKERKSPRESGEDSEDESEILEESPCGRWLKRREESSDVTNDTWMKLAVVSFRGSRSARWKLDPNKSSLRRSAASYREYSKTNTTARVATCVTDQVEGDDKSAASGQLTAQIVSVGELLGPTALFK
ncbi:unnamed protein product [Chrysodeixis includens]|uniref:Uncharacterized protein n=1 Tax=Chrysodeixis includens TaxID=689277 RepID=A0A9N8PZ43_CHRIL|nr:unnamed protein product [Chrysodeixis includens]